MLGKKSSHIDQCVKESFIGMDFGIAQDLSVDLPGSWREFNAKYRPVYLDRFPHKTKIAAGHACGALYSIVKGINEGDIVLSPDGQGSYHVGEVIGAYKYRPGEILFHRRPVRWFDKVIDRDAMSTELRKSAAGQATLREITTHGPEIQKLLGSTQVQVIVPGDDTVVDPAVFVLERHLEDFLVENWRQTELAREFDIYEEDGELVGRQYATDTGPIDILAISKDKKSLLVVELKKGRASDAVVGQIQRYMGYVIAELAEPNQKVRGVIIALEDDAKIKRALKVAQNIDFYRYEISFKLHKS